MIAASFVTLFFWLFIIFAGCTLMCLAADWLERRDRKRYREWLRARRAHLDSLEPQRWDDRQAHPWERAS